MTIDRAEVIVTGAAGGDVQAEIRSGTRLPPVPRDVGTVGVIGEHSVKSGCKERL